MNEHLTVYTKEHVYCLHAKRSPAEQRGANYMGIKNPHMPACVNELNNSAIIYKLTYEMVKLLTKPDIFVKQNKAYENRFIVIFAFADHGVRRAEFLHSPSRGIA